jgi:hypothetical protein
MYMASTYYSRWYLLSDGENKCENLSEIMLGKP